MVHLRMKIVSILLILATLNNSVQPAAASAKPNSAKVSKLGYDLMVKSIVKNLKPGQNLLISPYNIFYATLFFHLGARGETKDELTNFYRIPSESSEETYFYNSVSAVLDLLRESNKARVKISNSIFVQHGTRLKKSYLRASKKYLENHVHQVDFAKGGSEATDAFNNWVSKSTENRIPQALKSQLPTTAQLIASSVAFFNATWKQPFNKQNTKNEIFNTGVRQVHVPTMNAIGNILYNYNVDKKHEVIGIPFEGDEYIMFFFLPFKNTISPIFALNDYLDEAINMTRENRTTYVDYKLPSFRIGGFFSLKDPLMKTGVKRIFESAELSGMLEDGNHFNVSDINYVAGLQVNEDGTCTADSSSTKRPAEGANTPLALHPVLRPVRFYANRPFAFSTIHKELLIELFQGIVSNPSSKA